MCLIDKGLIHEATEAIRCYKVVFKPIMIKNQYRSLFFQWYFYERKHLYTVQLKDNCGFHAFSNHSEAEAYTNELLCHLYYADKFGRLATTQCTIPKGAMYQSGVIPAGFYGEGLNSLRASQIMINKEVHHGIAVSADRI